MIMGDFSMTSKIVAFFEDIDGLIINDQHPSFCCLGLKFVLIFISVDFFLVEVVA